MRDATFRVLCAVVALIWTAAASAERPRYFVLTDIGNEPDDQMSLVRLLTYSNEIDIEALVATTSTWQRDKVSPDIIQHGITPQSNITYLPKPCPAAKLTASIRKCLEGRLDRIAGRN